MALPERQEKNDYAASGVSTHGLNFLEARTSAVAEEMRRDAKVVLWGADVRYGLSGLGGEALVREFGNERVFDAPVSENAMIGIAVGAAEMGYRPVVELSVANFATYGFDQLVNQASRLRYLSGGLMKCPIVLNVRMQTMAAGGCHHTDRNYPMLMNVPGLKILCPSTPRATKGLWKAAIRDDDPVVIFERNALSVRREPVPDGEFILPIGSAEVVREGTDVTLVSICTLDESLGAVALLGEEGISIELIDALSLVPLDVNTILTSVEKTGHLVIVDIANDTNSAASHIAAIAADRGFEHLRAPIKRVCTPDVHIPHARPLEAIIFPTKERIAATVGALVKRT